MNTYRPAVLLSMDPKETLIKTLKVTGGEMSLAGFFMQWEGGGPLGVISRDAHGQKVKQALKD